MTYNWLRLREWLSLLAAVLAVMGVVQATASAPAHAQTQGQAQAPRAMPPPPPLVLGKVADSVRLAGHARAWVDDTGRRRIDDVVAAAETLAWTPFRQGGNYSLDDDALWVQFDVAIPPGSHYYLVLLDPGVDRLELYSRTPSGGWSMQAAGEDISVDEWPVPGRVPTLELAHGTGEPERYYARLERHRLTFTTPLRLYSQQQLHAVRDREQLLLGGYFGVLLLLGLGCVANALFYGDRNFRAFALYLTGVGVWQLVYLGVGAQHFWSEWPDWTSLARSITPGAAAAAAVWFIKVFTEPARFSRALDFSCNGAIAGLLSFSAVNAWLNNRDSQLVVLVAVAASALLAVLLLALAWRKTQDRYLRMVTLGFVPLALTAIAPVLNYFDVLAAGTWSRFGLTFGTAVQIPVVYYALSQRAMRRRETGVRAAELTHTDALTGLWDRDTLVARLENALQRALEQDHRCAILMARLTNYEELADEFGQDAADRALIVSASIVRAAAGEFDVAARSAPRDFALLIEGPTGAEVAVARAQQIVARGLQHSAVLPPTTTLKFHVAVALLPDHELDARRSLQWLEEACSAMRAEPKRAIRTLNF